MGKLLLIGGGHAHLTALANTDTLIARGHRVTLVSVSPYHYYSGMGPGLMAGIYRPQEVRFHVKKMVESRGGEFVRGRVVRVDPQGREVFLEDGRTIPYDVASFNTGSDIVRGPITGLTETMFTVKPIVRLLDARKRILEMLPGARPRILVLGGGPAGVEIAGNAWRLVTEAGGGADIGLVAGRRLLAAFPEKVRRLAKASLKARGIDIFEGQRVTGADGSSVTLDDGRTLPCDVTFIAMGTTPSPVFRDSGMPTDGDGGLLVNRYLQSVGHPEVFGGGDCIGLEGRRLEKVGVYAVRQNPVLYRNLLAALEGRELATFDPGGRYLLIFNLGDGNGIFWRGNWVWDGRLAFVLKDYIDRRFMRRFQLSGEGGEGE